MLTVAVPTPAFGAFIVPLTFASHTWSPQIRYPLPVVSNSNSSYPGTSLTPVAKPVFGSNVKVCVKHCFGLVSICNAPPNFAGISGGCGLPPNAVKEPPPPHPARITTADATAIIRVFLIISTPKYGRHPRTKGQILGPGRCT